MFFCDKEVGLDRGAARHGFGLLSNQDRGILSETRRERVFRSVILFF
jgi:hypothetical protein